MIICDAVECGATVESLEKGPNLCVRCKKAMGHHLVEWLADPIAQKKAREDQATRDEAERAMSIAIAELAVKRADEQFLEAAIKKISQRMRIQEQEVRSRFETELASGVTVRVASENILRTLRTELIQKARDAKRKIRDEMNTQRQDILDAASTLRRRVREKLEQLKSQGKEITPTLRAQVDREVAAELKKK